MDELNAYASEGLLPRRRMAPEPLLLAWLVAAAPFMPRAVSNALLVACIAWITALAHLRRALATPNALLTPAHVCIEGHGPVNSICVLCPGMHSNVPKTRASAPCHALLRAYAVVVLFDYSDGASHLDHLVDDAMRALTYAGGAGACAIAGYSLGGAVAMHLAERVRIAGGAQPLEIVMFAAPAHVYAGVTLPTIMSIGMRVFAMDLDTSRACARVGAPARVHIIHAKDDRVISIDHAFAIANMAARAGMNVTLDAFDRGGHKLTVLFQA